MSGSLFLQVSSAAEYRQVLQRHSIQLDPERRADAIWEAVGAAAQRCGGQVPESSRADLLPEVTNLVESPTAVLGTFDEAFLRLPRSVSHTQLRRVWLLLCGLLTFVVQASLPQTHVQWMRCSATCRLHACCP